jgi:hypothetical protein
LTNGNGLTLQFSINRKLSRISGIKKKARHSRLIQIVIISILLLVPLLFYFIDVTNTTDNKIVIDGNFQDWEGVAEFQDIEEDQIYHPNINIVNSKIVQNDLKLSFFLRVKGFILKGKSDPPRANEVDSVRIFIDRDLNLATGYSIKGLGADYLIEIHGINGQPLKSSLFKFDPNYRTKTIREQNDWNAWNNIQYAQVATSSCRLETQVILPEFNNHIVKHGRGYNTIFAFVHLQDTGGNNDYSDDILCNKPERLIVTQKSIAPEVLTNNISEVLEIEFNAIETDATINSVAFSHEGAGRLISLPVPINIDKNTKKSYKLKLNTSNVKNAAAMSLMINSSEDISVAEDLPVLLQGAGSTAYIKTPPTGISIDGLFGDWAGINKLSDLDAVPVSNPNVNISQYAILETKSSVFFYFQVKGKMLAGSDLPALPYIYHEPEQTTDRISISTHEKNPIPNLPIKTGEDALYIFLDSDNNKNTGYCPDSEIDVGAEYLVELNGQNGKLGEKNLMQFKGETRIDFTWENIDGLQAACKDSKLEGSIDFNQLVAKINSDSGSTSEINGLGIYIHIVDWTGEGDFIEHKTDLEEIIQDNPGNDLLLVQNSVTRSSEKVFTYNDPGFTQYNTKFCHNDIVFMTITDGIQFGNRLIAVVNNTDMDASIGNRIYIWVYDDGTHYDKYANDGIYSGSFVIQSLVSGGITDNETDTIAIVRSITINFEIPHSGDLDSGVVAPLHSPEFSDILIILPIVFILILISYERKNRTRARSVSFRTKRGVNRK